MRTVNFMPNLLKIERVTVNRDELLKRRTSLNLKNSFILELNIKFLHALSLQGKRVLQRKV